MVVTTGKSRCNRVPCLDAANHTSILHFYDCAIENGRKRVWATPDCSLPFQVERSSRCVYILVSHNNSDVALEFSSCDARALTCVGTSLPCMLATAPRIDWLSGGREGNVDHLLLCYGPPFGRGWPSGGGANVNDCHVL